MPPKKVRFAPEPQYLTIPARCHEENTVEIPFYDPIGMHLMALRTFYRGLLIHHRRKRRVRKIFRRPTMPEYPKDYPTSSYLYSLRRKSSRPNLRPQLCFRGDITKAQVDHIRTFAIQRILMMVGFEVEFSDDDDIDIPLSHLSYVCDVFLRSFVERLRFHKDSDAFYEDDDLWDPLETTLQEWGFQGVRGIAKYFYSDFAKMAETLSTDCIRKLEMNIEKERTKKKERKRLKRMKKQQTPTLDKSKEKKKAKKEKKRLKKLKKRQAIRAINSDVTIIEDNCVMEIDNTEMMQQQ